MAIIDSAPARAVAFCAPEERWRGAAARKPERNRTMWTKPSIVEVAVGLEINCYACADL